jgi:hypothetical protein
MKTGGNASATDFFTKHGGSSLLGDSDTKKKYSSRVAELYKEELAKRVKDDVARCVSMNAVSSRLSIPVQVPEWYRCRWDGCLRLTRIKGRD